MVSSLNPADEARRVPVANDLLVTFNEGIVRGSGTAGLKDAAGAVIEFQHGE
ncbi:MAG: Ig-like domain-containing protein [Rhodoferax sp.]|nr:Ig-like domain-containing protein [Rhodoferax sp.]